MTAVPSRTTRQAGRGPRPLTAAALRLATQPRTAGQEDDPATQLVATMDTQLRVLLDQQSQVEDIDDPEAVHQMRVAIRRLRVALRLGADELGPIGVELRAELGWLGGELGVVRDLDVLSGRLASAAAALGPADQDGVAEVLAYLHDSRVASRAELVATLAGPRYRALLRALARRVRITTPSTTSTSTTAATTATGSALAADPLALLDRPLRKLRREVASIGAQPTDDQLHTLRIRGKRLRYSAELAFDRCGRSLRKPLRRLIGAAKDLQEILGDHHDTVTAEHWLREAGAARPATLSGPALIVLGRLVERELNQRADHAAKWPLAWRELDSRADELD